VGFILLAALLKLVAVELVRADQRLILNIDLSAITPLWRQELLWIEGG
jgi:hypothetical protein